MRIGALSVVLISLIAGVAQAAHITTSTIAVASGTRVATLRATRVDGTAEPLGRSITLPGTADVTLGAGLWEIRIVGDGLWAPSAELRNEDSTAVRVWPAVTLTGTAKAVSALRLGFIPLDSDGAAGEVDCAVDHEAWKCSVPIGRYDLRFSSSGFAPEFRFAVTVRADAKQLPLNFIPGASLSGRIEAARGVKTSLDGVEVKLTSAAGESGAWKQSVRSSARGFFQFKGVAPGDYSIRGTAKDLTTQSQSVRILAGAAAELNAPLRLDTPKRLTVTVMPRLDPSGQRWRVRLVSNNARLRHGDILAESPLSDTGEWTHPHLIAGEYSIDVLTANGERWKSQEVTIEHDDVTVAVAAVATKITGSIHLGDRPLQASLSFPDEWGVKLHSESDGEFTGEIPPDEHQERVILVEAEMPRVKRTIRAKTEKEEDGRLRLQIRLPATTLIGRVLNADRSPDPHAFITVRGFDPVVFEQVFVEPDGSFQIAGFEPGSYRVIADATGRRSRYVSFELRKDESTEVELTLEPIEPLRGRITVGEIPVIAAYVYVFPRDSWAGEVPQATTNESGYFELELPPGTMTFDGLAVHPAFDIVFGRATLMRDKQMHIRTQQIGGTVVVERKPDDALLLVHNGGEITADWLANLAGGTVAPGRITVPRLQPGQYSACTMKDRKCASGYLPPHGTLTLTLASNTD